MRPLEPGDPRIAGEFRLRARLGVGGMGRVYLGYSPAGRAVAVKICHPELAADPAFLRRFALEVTAARAVNGLYTAQVIDAGPDDDPPWLATSYVPGPSLYDAVIEHGPLPEPAVWRLAAGLAEALRDVHIRGLVHRDLKPANVLLAADGPRVIDFGVARALDGTSLTTTGIAFGTPAYMSPEQAEGRPAGQPSDVFALGSVLCFAATGDVPFGDGDAPSVLFRIVREPPVLDQLPGSLRGLVSACLAKDPAARPALPEVLYACRADTPQPGRPAASFWPGQIATLIAGYQAGLDGTASSVETDGEPTHVVTGHALARGGTWPGPGQASGPLSRRRALAGLAGLAGLAVAGLAVGGWEFSRSGSPERRAATSRTPGRLSWAHETSAPVSSGAAISDGILYIGSDDGNVYGFDAASGHVERRFQTSGAVSGAVTTAGSTLFAGSAGHHVHAFPIGTGGAKWTHQTDGPVHCAPAVANGAVYVGSDDHYVYALDAGSGQRIWRRRTGGPVRSSPLPGHSPFDGHIYVGSDDTYLYTLDTGTGRVQWRFPTGGPVNSGPMADATAGIYVGNDEGLLYEVLAGDNEREWQSRVGGALHGTPVYAGSTLYVGSAPSAGAAVYALDMGNGQQIWNYSTSGPVSSGPALAGGVLYVGDDHGYLYAIDITSASLRWRYRVGGPVRSRILVTDGVVYFGSFDRHVYALRT